MDATKDGQNGEGKGPPITNHPVMQLCRGIRDLPDF